MSRSKRKDNPESADVRPRAAAYVRMSTEHQQYSTENQRDVIAAFAESRNYELVRTYADEGKSGLRLEGREALKALLRDVESGTADFSLVLVYDVSRWGRFRIPMKVPAMRSGVSTRAFACCIAPNNLRTMAVRSRAS